MLEGIISLMRGRHAGIPEAQWDREFAAGKWSRLWDADESAHQFVAAGLLGALRPDSILDVGCGQGAFKAQLSHMDYRKYVGIDVSSAALDVARERDSDPRALYVHADAETWRPPGSFDVITFIESIVYLRSPADVVRRYIDEASPAHVVVSLFGPKLTGRPYWQIFREAGLSDPVHRFVVRNASGKQWTVACFRTAAALRA